MTERMVYAKKGQWYDCPCCGSNNTDCLGQDYWFDGYAELNKCYDCGCRFEVNFAYAITVIKEEGSNNE